MQDGAAEEAAARRIAEIKRQRHADEAVAARLELAARRLLLQRQQEVALV